MDSSKAERGEVTGTALGGSAAPQLQGRAIAGLRNWVWDPGGHREEGCCPDAGGHGQQGCALLQKFGFVSVTCEHESGEGLQAARTRTHMRSQLNCP